MAEGETKGIEAGAFGLQSTIGETCLLSIAISLKRIADVVDPPAVIAVDSQLTPEQVEELRAQWKKPFAGAPPPPPDWDNAKGDQPSRLGQQVAQWLRRMGERGR